jgi:hypothetical protein
VSKINITAGEELDPGDAVKLVDGRAFRMSDWKTTQTKWPASNGWVVTETRHLPHRTNRLHRRPAKWWRHPVAWQKPAAKRAFLGEIRGWYDRLVSRLSKRMAREKKNGKA